MLGHNITFITLRLVKNMSLGIVIINYIPEAPNKIIAHGCVNEVPAQK